jgi:4,5-dihydroxyphthalate decarboxylase
MPKLELSVATVDYDRVRPLIDGTVAIDGVAPVFMTLDPEEIFFRAFRHAEFDIAELSLSSFTVRVARGDSPYVGVPVFPSRAFRHSGVYIRTDRGIHTPADLRGRKVGLAEYQLTANVWIRAFLDDDFQVEPASIQWVRGGIETPGRPEKVPITLPHGVSVTEAPAGRSLSELLLAGEIDFTIAPCSRKGATLVVDVGGAELAGKGAKDRTLPDVDDCLVAVGDLRVEGCDIRPVRIAVAILPRDCSPYEIECGCCCC